MSHPGWNSRVARCHPKVILVWPVSQPGWNADETISHLQGWLEGHPQPTGCLCGYPPRFIRGGSLATLERPRVARATSRGGSWATLRLRGGRTPPLGFIRGASRATPKRSGWPWATSEVATPPFLYLFFFFRFFLKKKHTHTHTHTHIYIKFNISN
jgi:hypothetical protein